MSVDLLKELSTLKVVGDRETETAFFMTRTPWIGPESYQHIIYKPVVERLLLESAKMLRMPQSVIEFFAKQNGGHLFSGALHIFGVIWPGRQLNRKDPLLLPPFNIEWENSQLYGLDRNQLLAIGGYGFDRSTVCIDREDGRVSLYLRGHGTPDCSWHSLEHWIRSEIARLAILFDGTGRRLVDESATIPDKESNVQ